MDEVTLLVAVGSFVLGGGVGALINHAYRPPEVIEVMVPMAVASSVTVDSAHVHECNHYDAADGKGWRCYLCWKAGVYTPMERAERNRGN